MLLNLYEILKKAIPTITRINYWDQLNSWKNHWKFWNCPLWRNKSGPSSLLNVAVYWQSSSTEACARKLSQILANDIDNGGRGLVSEFMRYSRYACPGSSYLGQGYKFAIFNLKLPWRLSKQIFLNFKIHDWRLISN